MHILMEEMKVFLVSYSIIGRSMKMSRPKRPTQAVNTALNIDVFTKV